MWSEGNTGPCWLSGLTLNRGGEHPTLGPYCPAKSSGLSLPRQPQAELKIQLI